MDSLIDVVVPVFGIIGLGFAATFTRAFDAQLAKALSGFVFTFALPLMLFRRLSLSELPDDGMGAFLAVYFAGAGLNGLVGLGLFGLLFKQGFVMTTILAFGSAYANTVLLGIPLVLQAYGDAGAVPLFVLIAFHGVVFFTLVTVMIETAGGSGEIKGLFARTVKGLATNPIFLGLAAGLAANLAGLRAPRALDGMLVLIGGAALPCALFSLGAALRAYPLRGALPLALAVTGLKLGLQPIIVFALANLAGLPPLWVKVATLSAAMPTGINVYLFAARYRAGEAEAAAIILLSTALSPLSLSLVLVLLG